MSAVIGVLTGVGLLIIEEVLVTSKGGPAAVTGVLSTLVNAIDHFADPTLPAIANHAKTSTKKPPTNAPPKGALPAPNGSLTLPPSIGGTFINPAGKRQQMQHPLTGN